MNKPPGLKERKTILSMKAQNLIHILIGLVCLLVLPQMQAVTPAPDGGYAGGNTAEGLMRSSALPLADTTQATAGIRCTR